MGAFAGARAGTVVVPGDGVATGSDGSGTTVVVVVVVGITGGSPSASMSSPYTHTAAFTGTSPDAQIMSIAATLTRTQPWDAA